MSLDIRMGNVALASHGTERPWTLIKPQHINGANSMRLGIDVTDVIEVSFVRGVAGTTAVPSAADTARIAANMTISLTANVPYVFTDGISGEIWIRKATAAASVRNVSCMY